MGTVLVIETDESLQSGVREALEGLDLVFADLELAVRLEPERSRPEVILMDVDLPSEGGFEFLRRLRIEPEARGIPVVFLSHSTDALARFGSRAVAVVGPEDMDTLAAVVASLLRESTIYQAFSEALASLAPAPVAGSADLTPLERDVLTSGGLDVDAPLSPRPIARRAVLHQQILESSLTTAGAARRLGVNSSRIRQRLTGESPDLYGLRIGKAWRLPEFQFSKNGLVPNIEKVIAKLDLALDPVAVSNWFHSPNEDLEDEGEFVCPLDWLAQGKDWELVAMLAEDL